MLVSQRHRKVQAIEAQAVRPGTVELGISVGGAAYWVFEPVTHSDKIQIGRSRAT